MNIKAKHPIDGLYDIVEFTLSQPNVIVKSKYAVDPINNYAESAFGIKLSTDNPVNMVDKLYDILKNISEAKNQSRSTGKGRDEDKDVLERTFGAAILGGNDSENKVISSFGTIKDQVNQKQFNPRVKYSDPANSLAEKSFMPDILAVKPSHTMDQVKTLIRQCYPATNFNLDAVNDLTGNNGLSLSKIKAKHSFDEVCNLVDNIVTQVIPVHNHFLKLDVINQVAAEKFGFKSNSKVDQVVIKEDEKETAAPAASTTIKPINPVSVSAQNVETKPLKTFDEERFLAKFRNILAGVNHSFKQMYMSNSRNIEDMKRYHLPEPEPKK